VRALVDADAVAADPFMLLAVDTLATDHISTSL
jgi:hypothetical protein